MCQALYWSLGCSKRRPTKSQFSYSFQIEYAMVKSLSNHEKTPKTFYPPFHNRSNWFYQVLICKVLYKNFLVHLGCYNKNAIIWMAYKQHFFLFFFFHQPGSSKHLFHIVLETGTSRSWCQQVWCLVRACVLIMEPSLCVFTWRKWLGISLGPLLQGQ